MAPTQLLGTTPLAFIVHRELKGPDELASACKSEALPTTNAPRPLSWSAAVVINGILEPLAVRQDWMSPQALRVCLSVLVSHVTVPIGRLPRRVFASSQSSRKSKSSKADTLDGVHHTNLGLPTSSRGAVHLANLSERLGSMP